MNINCSFNINYNKFNKSTHNEKIMFCIESIYVLTTNPEPCRTSFFYKKPCAFIVTAKALLKNNIIYNKGTHCRPLYSWNKEYAFTKADKNNFFDLVLNEYKNLNKYNMGRYYARKEVASEEKVKKTKVAQKVAPKVAMKVNTKVAPKTVTKTVRSTVTKTINAPQKFVTTVSDKDIMKRFSDQQLWDELKNRGFSIVNNQPCKQVYLQ